MFAALNTATGEVRGKTAQRHTSEQFVRFLEDIVADHDEDQQIHVICDNVSSHNPAGTSDQHNMASNKIGLQFRYSTRDAYGVQTLPAGPQSLSSHLVVGTLQEVQAGLLALYTSGI